MSHAHLLDKPILDLIPLNCGTIVDLGCGYGTWGFYIKTRKKCKLLVGLDVWKPYLIRLKTMKIYDALILCKLPYLPFREKIFDVVVACEVLEHLIKRDGLKLLVELEMISKKFIVISIPLNYVQEGFDGNAFEEHISEWDRNQLEALGYEVEELKTLPRSLAFLDTLRRLMTGMAKRPIFLIGKTEVTGA